MNNEENKKQDLNYDFNFENQVVQDETNQVKENVEVLTDEVEPLEELTEVEEKNSDNVEDVMVELDSNNEPIEEQKTKEPAKKIKILNKEFNLEDVVLVLMGLAIVVAIFLLPRIMKMF